VALNRQQKRFAELLAADQKIGEAYVNAGYRAKDSNIASCNGSRLFASPEVRAYYNALRQRAAAEAGLTAQRVMEELRAVALSDIDDYRLRPDGTVALAPDAHPLARRAIASKKFTVTRKVTTVPPAAEGAEPSTTVTEVTEGEIRLWPKVEALKLAAQVTGLTKEDDRDAVVVEIDRVVIRAAAKSDVSGP
jgi:phage terminase small subunit